jgi:hypothetical protein
LIKMKANFSTNDLIHLSRWFLDFLISSSMSFTLPKGCGCGRSLRGCLTTTNVKRQLSGKLPGLGRTVLGKTLKQIIPIALVDADPK